MFAPQVHFVTSSLEGMITYLLWQCLQLGGTVEEVPSGTTMLKRQVSEEVKMQNKQTNKRSEISKHTKHFSTTSKQNYYCKEVQFQLNKSQLYDGYSKWEKN